MGDKQEWPATASLALDKMIAELKDARQERSRFDTFIRTHTFLDPLTGAAKGSYSIVGCSQCCRIRNPWWAY